MIYTKLILLFALQILTVRGLTQGCVITCPDDIFVNLGPGECEAVVNYSVSSENCNGSIMQTEGLPSGSSFPIGTTTNAFAVSDAGGNSFTCSFDVIVQEYAPGISPVCNAEINVSVNQQCEAFVSAYLLLEGGPYECYDNYLVMVDGFGSGIGGVLIDGSAVGQTLGATVTDPGTGNSCTPPAQVFVADVIPPSIECIGFSVPCNQLIDPDDFPPTVTMEEAVTLGLAIGPDGGSVTTAQIETFLLNPSGTIVDVNVTIDLDHTWSSDLDVFLISPGGISVELATDVCGENDDWENVTFDDEAAIAVQDACGSGPALTGSVQPEGSLADIDGAWVNGYWTLEITDDTGGDGGTLNFFGISVEVYYGGTPSATDNCGILDLTYTDSESGDFCNNLTVTRTWVAADLSGNTASCQQEILIEPFNLTDVECPPNHVGPCDQSIDPSVTGYPTVNGNTISETGYCNMSADYTDMIIPDCITEITRTWIVTDTCTQENMSCTQVIIRTDDEAPILLCPPDITVNACSCSSIDLVELTTPEAWDACGSDFVLTPQIGAGTLEGMMVHDLPIGNHVVTWTAEDVCENDSSCTYTITVVPDERPVLDCPASITVDACSCNSIDVLELTLPEVFDVCESSFDFSATTNNGGTIEASTAYDLPVGLNVITWVVEDQCANTEDCIYGITVLPPDLAYAECPADTFLSCAFGTSPAFTGLPTYQGMPLYENGPCILSSYSDEEEVIGGDLNITRTWTFTDTCSGEKETCLQMIVLTDDEPPSVECPADVSVSCNTSTSPDTTGVAIASDDCTQATVAYADDLVEDCDGNNAFINRTWIATDDGGNTASCVQVITILPPDFGLLQCPPDYAGMCGQSIDPQTTGSPTYDGNQLSSSGSCHLAATYSDQEMLVDGATQIIRTWTISDTCSGLDTMCMQTITLTDSLSMFAASGSFCPGDSVQVLGTWYTAAGEYMDTIPNDVPGGCDSIYSIAITAADHESDTLDGSFCAGDSVQILGKWYSEAGSYMDTLFGVTPDGCDSIYTITVTMTEYAMGNVSGSFCPGDSVLVRGTWYDSPGEYTETVDVQGGCDSVYTIAIEELSDESVIIMDSLCPGDSVWILGTWYSEAGTFVETRAGAASNGCDSIYAITISEIEFINANMSGSFCAGDSVEILGTWYDSAGTYTHTVAYPDGCDTVYTIEVVGLENEFGSMDGSFCSGDSVLVLGQWYSEAGEYTKIIEGVATNGCDSIYTVTIAELMHEEGEVSASFCAGDSVLVLGRWYSEEGTFTEMIAGAASNGCDSVYTITITETEFADDSITASFCSGDSVEVLDKWYSTPGTYFDTIPDAEGCDVTYEITIVELEPGINDTSAVICEGEGIEICDSVFMLNNTNEYTVVCTNSAANGCDSIVNLDLTIESTVPTAMDDTWPSVGGNEFVAELLENDDLNGRHPGEFEVNILEIDPDEVEIVRTTASTWNISVSLHRIPVIVSIRYEVCDTECPEFCDEATARIEFTNITTDRLLTPNGDGHNDLLFFEGVLDYHDSELIIVNRWGDVVYRAKPYLNDWGGTGKNGVLLPQGTYYYILRNVETPLPNAGTIVILK